MGLEEQRGMMIRLCDRGLPQAVFSLIVYQQERVFMFMRKSPCASEVRTLETESDLTFFIIQHRENIPGCSEPICQSVKWAKKKKITLLSTC